MRNKYNPTGPTGATGPGYAGYTGYTGYPEYTWKSKRVVICSKHWGHIRYHDILPYTQDYAKYLNRGDSFFQFNPNISAEYIVIKKTLSILNAKGTDYSITVYIKKKRWYHAFFII